MQKKRFIFLLHLLVLTFLNSCSEANEISSLESSVVIDDSVIHSTSDELSFQEVLHRSVEPEPLSPQTSYSSPRIQKGSTVMLAGDSLGVGMSDRFRNLALSVGYKPVIETASGTSTFQWITWIKKYLQRHKPALLLLSLGTNDAMQIDRAKKIDVYSEMSKIIRESNVELIWILPHRIDLRRIPKIDEARDFIRSSVPLCFDSTSIEIPLAPDRVHTSKKGYDRWIESVWKWMAEIKMIDSGPK